MRLFIELFSIFIAGLFSGSFAVPMKWMPKWRHENIWVQFVVWSFFILPLLTLWFVMPEAIEVYFSIPMSLWLWIICGGLFFGIGQACFVASFPVIGMGLGFVINLGLGTSLGFMLPLIFQHPEYIFTSFGLVTMAGVMLVVIAILVANLAGLMRDKTKNENGNQKALLNGNYSIGIILAAIAGLSSASQNFVFSMTFSMQSLAVKLGATNLGAANILWPIYLLVAGLPYGGYMLYKNFRNKSLSLCCKEGSCKYYLYIIMMSVFAYGALFAYSASARKIGKLGPVIGWPVFMVSVLLASNLWGAICGEWHGCCRRTTATIKLGVLFMLLAVIVLGYGSTLNPNIM